MVFGLMLAAAASVNVQCADVGDFAKWKLPSPYRVERGELAYEATEWKKHGNPTLSIKPEPFSTYRFTARMQVKGMTNTVQMLCTWFDANNRRIGSTIGTRSCVNDVDASGWRTYSAISKSMPTNAAKLTLAFYVRDGACGKYRAKDCKLEVLPEVPLADLVSSRYRDEAADGNVRFVAAAGINEAKHPLGSLKAVLKFNGADGPQVREMSLSREKAEVSLAVRDFAVGRQAVVCELGMKNGGGWETLAARTNFFTRLEKPVRRRVSIDGNRRFLVDGKPFFPVVMTIGTRIPKSRWPEVIGMLKGTAFNTVLVYDHNVTPEDLDMFWANGLMLKYNLKDAYTGFPQVNPPYGVKTREDEVRYVKEKVALLKDHPALFCWYINDEFPVDMVGRVKERTELLHELDGDHPTSICLCQPDSFRQYLGAADIYGSDPYPVGRREIASAIAAGEDARKWAKTTYGQLFGLRAMLQTVQAFDWGWFHKDWHNTHFPTREELRLMAQAQVEEGATGIGFFSISCMLDGLKGENFDRAFDDVKSVAAELGRR